MQSVNAEMTGTVVSVEVAPGQSVSAGAALVILESMKMEVPVNSPVDAVVDKVHVAAGETVNEGQPLVDLS